MTLRISHRAMGTQFEMWLCGDDEVHLQSVAFKAWAEVDRLDLLLSRYDSRAEIARINREAAERPVRIEVELFDILLDCQEWATRTRGYFDIAYASENLSLRNKETPMLYVLNAEQRTIHFSHAGVSLDLGGYGKGYALDRVIATLKAFGISSACVHGGHSSVIAIGTEEEGAPWSVQIPHYNQAKPMIEWRPLINEGFSYSATHASNEDTVADIVDPFHNQVIHETAACWVVSASALQAEVWTTALLAMGQDQAINIIGDVPLGVSEMGWI